MSLPKNLVFDFDQAILEGISQIPELNSKFKKDYGKDYILFINENLTFHEVEERYGLISEEYEFVSDDLWKRIGSLSPPGGKILENGKRFNTFHSNDSIFLKTNCFDRTVFQEIFYRKGEANFFRTAKWIEEHFPELGQAWRLRSAQETFQIEPIEVIEADEDKIKYLQIKKKYENFKNPILKETFMASMVLQCAHLAAFTNQETFVLSNLETLFGTISATLQCIPTDDSHIGRINLNGITSSTFKLHVGETGDGKSGPFKIIFERLISQFPNIKNLFYINQIGSSPATQSQIAKSPTKCFAQDEITLFLEKAMKGDPLHEATLNLLLKYYTPTTEGATDLKEEAYGVVRNPHISFTGGTTLGFYKKYNTSAMAEAGHIRRIEIVMQDKTAIPKHMDEYIGKPFNSDLIDDLKILESWVGRAKYQLDVREERIIKKRLKNTIEYYEFLPGYAKAPIILTKESRDYLYEIYGEYSLCADECGIDLFKDKFRTCHDLIIRKAIVYAFTENHPREWLIPSEEIIEWDSKVKEYENILLEEERRAELAEELDQPEVCSEYDLKDIQNRLNRLRNNTPSKFPIMRIERRHCEWAYGEIMKRFFIEMRNLAMRSKDAGYTAEDKISPDDLQSLFTILQTAWEKESQTEIPLNSIGAFKMKLSRINKKIKQKISQKEILNLLKNKIQIRTEMSANKVEKIFLTKIN